MESSWWACESCHSVNHPGASACYKCRAFKGQQPSGTAQTSPTGSTSFPTPVVPYGNPTTASYGVPSAAQYWPGIPAPQGAVIAGMGVRTGAWILDALLAGLLSLIPIVVALVSGAISINQQALNELQQYQYQYQYGSANQPFASITAPILNIDLGPIVLAAVVYIAVRVAYFAGCWIKIGGSPAQRLLRLRVADNATGTNLSIDQALLRWGLLEGIASVVGAVFLVALLNLAATTPLNQLSGEATGTTLGTGSFGAINLVSNLVSLGSSLWMIILIVSAGASSLHRGLHDRMVGSIVLRNSQAYQSWPGYGYAPQASAYWPQLPPDDRTRS